MESVRRTLLTVVLNHGNGNATNVPTNTATGGNVTLTGQATGASGLVLDITSLSAAATSFNVV